MMLKNSVNKTRCGIGLNATMEIQTREELGVPLRNKPACSDDGRLHCHKPFALEEGVNEVQMAYSQIGDALECWPGHFTPDLRGIHELWNFFFIQTET